MLGLLVCIYISRYITFIFFLNYVGEGCHCTCVAVRGELVEVGSSLVGPGVQTLVVQPGSKHFLLLSDLNGLYCSLKSFIEYLCKMSYLLGSISKASCIVSYIPQYILLPQQEELFLLNFKGQRVLSNFLSCLVSGGESNRFPHLRYIWTRHQVLVVLSFA